MSSLFGRLNFNADAAGDVVQENSPAVQKHLETLPPLLPSWAMQDMKDNNVGGYYVNPVASISQNLHDYAQNIRIVDGINTDNCALVFAAANTLVSVVPPYILHTNRLSGVTAPNASTITLPHLDTAMNTGKTLCVLLYQTDGIQNNAPMVGSFTSLYTKDKFTEYANRIITYADECAATINLESYSDESGTTYTYYTSNLTLERAESMVSDLNYVSYEMSSRKSGDEAFFTKSQQILSEYGSLKKYNNIGASESSMNEMVGSDKLKTRLNS